MAEAPVQSSSSPLLRRYGEPAWTSRSDPIANPLASMDQSFEEWLVAQRASRPKGSLFDEVRRHNPLAVLSDNGNMIDVVVGEGPPSTWHLHEALICRASRFFRVSMRQPFREAAERKVHLKETNNTVFAVFVQWLYSCSFDTSSMDLLLRAYALGDLLNAPAFRTAAFDRIFALGRSHTFSTEQLLWVTENTMPNSALHKFVLNTVALRIISGQAPILSQGDWDTLSPASPDLFKAIIRLVHHYAQRNRAIAIRIPGREDYRDPP
ncbi:hypothetical protein FQN50_007744 [Emmonsiellopsis sp. PD_5]|nr:hypothetical protein FQN50_007744 [Emmonsiellopsis sp. PD_5]